jgi:hypothetical protein
MAVRSCNERRHGPVAPKGSPMTATTTINAPATPIVQRRRAHSLVAAGAGAGAVASAATTAVAAIAHAAGVSLAVHGQSIPLLGFAQLTFVASLLGIVIAVCLARWARYPRRTFLLTTLGLTVVSLVPDLLADAAGSTRVTLMLTHIVAAAIVVPALARRLPSESTQLQRCNRAANA